MAYDRVRQVVVMHGGDAGATILDDTWEWDGTCWASVTTGRPGRRWGAAMTFDEGAGKIVLFGGYDGTGFLADTWTYDGTWAQVPGSVHTPSARRQHGLIYQPGVGTILFGGFNGSGVVGDSRHFLVDHWTQAVADESPGIFDMAATLHRTSGNIAAQGGNDGMFTLSGVLQRSASIWSNVVTMSDGGNREGHAMAFDEARGELVMHGGIVSGGPRGDTMTSSTVGNWVTRTAFPSPGARWGHAMAYDVARQRVVLFGGRTTMIALADTWVWNGSMWTSAD